MRDSVKVSVSARLHLGFLDLHGGLGRRFGSLGMAIEEPATSIELTRSSKDLVQGPQAERAEDYLDCMVRELGLPSGHGLSILDAIPAHAGLGSGTQLALAIAAALRKLHRLTPDSRADAMLLDRSGRSGLGLGFFLEGGIALDGGRSDDGPPAPVIARFAIPPAWRVLLILDRSRQGLHGSEELTAFSTQPAFPAELAAHLCRVALMQALPAAAEGDVSLFGRAVTEIQAHIGDHFSAAQGGRYASPAVAALLNLLAANGVEGYGQSSWGPTGFALAGSPAEAARLQLLAAPLAASSGLELRIVRGRNRGAAIGSQASLQGVRHG